MKFTIPRNKWRNSHHGKGTTLLLNREGYQCCLGFCAEQLGIEHKTLLNKSNPYSLIAWCNYFDTNRIFVTGVTVDAKQGFSMEAHTPLTNRAITINDSDTYDLQLKEQLLTKLFEEHGHELEFVGEYEVD